MLLVVPFLLSDASPVKDTFFVAHYSVNFNDNPFVCVKKLDLSSVELLSNTCNVD